jgi:uncharacterized protein YlxW (UPF0749 family)
MIIALVVILLLALFAGVLVLATRARSSAYHRRQRDELRISRRLEKREEKLRNKAKRRQSQLAKKRLIRMKKRRAQSKP